MPEAKVEITTSNFFQRMGVTVENFLASFYKDYDSVGLIVDENAPDEAEKTVLDVWIGRGTEWGEILKELADEDFTPKTGIVVNLHVLPSGQLATGSVNTILLSVTSGTAPDVALSVDYNLPGEFAFREAVVDLTQFDDFEEVASQFYESSLVPYTYRGGVYALPETMDFTVMIYRQDVMRELGIDLPETWTDLYQRVLPRLYENNMSFSLPVDTSVSSNSPGALRGFTMLLLQMGGEYYNGDGESSALDTPEAYKAFKFWTDMYANYGIDAESNFFTRIRTGTMPIGISNYTGYLQLLTSAPELYGVAMSTIWLILFSGDRYGYINNLLLRFGIIMEPILWTKDADYVLPVIMIITIWMSMGNGFLSFLAGFQNIDPSMYEAGRVDGIKNKFQELRLITIPLMKPQMLFGAINSIVGAFAVFDVATAVAGMPSPNYAAHTIVAHLYDYAFTRFNMGYASSVAMVLFLITFFLGRLCMRLFHDET